MSDAHEQPLPQLLMRRPDLYRIPGCGVADGLELRTATRDDEAGLAGLLSDAFGMEWTAGHVHAALTGNPKVDRVYVVVQGSNLLATASARLDQVAFPGSGYVHWVGCANASRRKGLGRAVCGAVLARFAETGCKDAVLETDDDRLPAIGLYLALGFVPEPRHAGDAERWKHVRQQLDAAEKET